MRYTIENSIKLVDKHVFLILLEKLSRKLEKNFFHQHERLRSYGHFFDFCRIAMETRFEEA